MADLIDGGYADADKHGQARALVEKALGVRRAGEDDRADLLMDEARRTDPLAVEDVLMELDPGALAPDDASRESAAASDRRLS